MPAPYLNYAKLYIDKDFLAWNMWNLLIYAF